MPARVDGTGRRPIPDIDIAAIAGNAARSPDRKRAECARADRAAAIAATAANRLRVYAIGIVAVCLDAARVADKDAAAVAPCAAIATNGRHPGGVAAMTAAATNRLRKKTDPVGAAGQNLARIQDARKAAIAPRGPPPADGTDPGRGAADPAAAADGLGHNTVIAQAKPCRDRAAIGHDNIAALAAKPTRAAYRKEPGRASTCATTTANGLGKDADRVFDGIRIMRADIDAGVVSDKNTTTIATTDRITARRYEIAARSPAAAKATDGLRKDAVRAAATGRDRRPFLVDHLDKIAPRRRSAAATGAINKSAIATKPATAAERLRHDPRGFVPICGDLGHVVDHDIATRTPKPAASAAADDCAVMAIAALPAEAARKNTGRLRAPCGDPPLHDRRGDAAKSRRVARRARCRSPRTMPAIAGDRNALRAGAIGDDVEHAAADKVVILLKPRPRPDRQPEITALILEIRPRIIKRPIIHDQPQITAEQARHIPAFIEVHELISPQRGDIDPRRPGARGQNRIDRPAREKPRFEIRRIGIIGVLRITPKLKRRHILYKGRMGEVRHFDLGKPRKNPVIYNRQRKDEGLRRPAHPVRLIAHTGRLDDHRRADGVVIHINTRIIGPRHIRCNGTNCKHQNGSTQGPRFGRLPIGINPMEDVIAPAK